jgi:undecaprenyl-diphosphatase
MGDVARFDSEAAIVVLAHWASDVVAGFALGALTERLLRFWTGYPLRASKEDEHANP